MSTPKETQPFEQVVRRVEPKGKLLRAWNMTGGVSAEVIALEIALPNGQIIKMVVRRHGEVDRQQNPNIAADEFKLLQILKSAGLPVPTPQFLDISCEIFPFPYTVLEYVEGKPEFAPPHLPGFISLFARLLSKIHSVNITPQDLSFLPKQQVRVGKRPAILDLSLAEGLIRDSLESFTPLPRLNERVLLHDDFWPGNVLWNDGRIAAIIDWEDAKLGDPLADVANSRLEILWAFGGEAMDEFTRHYEAITTIDFTFLPYWDLCAALRPASKLSTWGLDENTEKRMRRRHRWFVTQALENLERQLFKK